MLMMKNPKDLEFEPVHPKNVLLASVVHGISCLLRSHSGFKIKFLAKSILITPVVSFTAKMAKMAKIRRKKVEFTQSKFNHCVWLNIRRKTDRISTDSNNHSWVEFRPNWTLHTRPFLNEFRPFWRKTKLLNTKLKLDLVDVSLGLFLLATYGIWVKYCLSDEKNEKNYCWFSRFKPFMAKKHNLSDAGADVTQNLGHACSLALKRLENCIFGQLDAPHTQNFEIQFP
jgi:hypothetical protein